MLSHTNATQEQRYWVHTEKFNGYNGNFLSFINELAKEIAFQMLSCKEGSRIWKVMERSTKYLQLLYNLQLATEDEINRNEQVRDLLTAFEIFQLPDPVDKNRDKTKRQARRNRYNAARNVEELIEVEVNSDIEEPHPAVRQHWPAGWLQNINLREVGDFLMKIVDSAIVGAAKEVVIGMGNPRDRNGFSTITRLAEVYGRNSAHIAMLPQVFEWGTKSLPEDWNDYKSQINTTQYLRLHPGNEKAVVMGAWTGFLKYNNFNRLHDHLRVTCGENADWEPFSKAVNKFIGDIHRVNFHKAILTNENGIATMSAAGVLQNSKHFVGNVTNSFKPKGAPYAKKGAGRGKNKDSGNDHEVGKNKGNNKDLGPKEKKGSKKCAWCGDTSHQYFRCPNVDTKKWANKVCTRCKGTGHPSETCSTPAQSKL